MVTPELIEFIKKEESKGVSRESIISLLRTQSWTDVDIMEAFDVVSPLINKSISSEVNSFQTINTSISQSIINSNLKPKSSKKLIISVIVILALCLIGIFGYASGYFTTFNSLFSQSIKSFQNTNGMTFDFNITADMSSFKALEEASSITPGSSKVFNFNIKSSYDISNKDNIKSNSSIFATSGNFGFGLDFRIVDGSLYANLTKAPELGVFSLKPFENKWISFPYKSTDMNNDPLTSSIGINTNTVSNLTEEQKKHIANIFERASLIKITKRHLPEILDGSLSFHFDFDLDKKGIITYSKELFEYLRSIDKNSSQLSYINDSDFEKSFDSIKDFHGEVWLGMFDNLPHKSIINFNFINPEKLDDGFIKISSNIVYSDWNKVLKVEVPKDATTLEKLLSSVMGVGMFGSSSNEMPQVNNNQFDQSQLLEAQSNSNDATIQSVESALRAQAELYYDSNSNSYTGFCRSKSSYGAYTYAIKLPKGTEYKCNDSNNSWASWSKLSNGKYFCVDSVGVVESILGLPQGTSCPSR